VDEIALEPMDLDIPGLQCLVMDKPPQGDGSQSAGRGQRERYLTQTEAARSVGLSPHIVARWARTGLLPCIVICPTDR